MQRQQGVQRRKDDVLLVHTHLIIITIRGKSRRLFPPPLTRSLPQHGLRTIMDQRRRRRPGAIDNVGGHRERRVKARLDLDSAWLEDDC